MKTLIIAALSATLLCGAENAKLDQVPKGASVVQLNDRLSESEIKEWKAIEAKLNAPDPNVLAKKQAADAAKLAYYEAKEAFEKAQADLTAEINAKFDKLRTDAKCPGCQLDPKELKWIRPAAEAKK